jgi:site-specific recombinase XerD
VLPKPRHKAKNAPAVTTYPILEHFIGDKKATKGLTVSGEKWLRVTLGPFLKWLPVPLDSVNRAHIVSFLGQYQGKPWRKHSFYRAFKTFFKWASEEYHIENPTTGIPAPKTPDVLLHTTTPTDVERLIEAVDNPRDKALIALLADSGARRSETANIAIAVLDLARNRIKVMGKGNKEGWLVFGARTRALLTVYIGESHPTGKLFDLNTYGIQSMLCRLGRQTGIQCNAHSFRRGFATALRHAGVGELDIQQLGRWSSLEMVRRYTKAYTFDNAAARYKPIVT